MQPPLKRYKAEAGEDSDGRHYESVADLWQQELGGAEGSQQWYAKASAYWESQEATLAGVLGGYPDTHAPDIRESRRFLSYLGKLASPPSWSLALDCGAGIGRVTRGLLLDIFEQVELLEPNERLLETARHEVSSPRVLRYLSTSLQSFIPDPGRYDIIWAQWVLLYLTDDDLVMFLRRCASALSRHGLVCIKENVQLEGKWKLDKDDNSIARTPEHYKAIFAQAKLSVVLEMKQVFWPSDLMPVMMYALRPMQNE
mmetsp:Transcript_1893/g.3770  ORF Transcript_1893/g.3770 Transcript_1893/m.3770 type:complete len:256 (-) Transcript_1893:41-808(-)